MAGIRGSRLSESQQVRLLEFFVKETSARGAAGALGIQANSAVKFYWKVREMILEKERSHRDYGELVLDVRDSPNRKDSAINGQSGRDTGGKIPVFGIWAFLGDVDCYTEMIADPRTGRSVDCLDDVVFECDPFSIVYTQRHERGSIVEFSEFQQFELWHRRDIDEVRKYIEAFWLGVQLTLRKYPGISGEQFFLLVKEREFRANYYEETCELQLMVLKKWFNLRRVRRSK